MGISTLETRRADNFGGIARAKNTRRVFVPPNAWAYPTGTWTPTFAANVFSMDKTAADNTCVAYVPCPAPQISDAAVESSAAAVDRGVRPIALEIMYSVATAALDAVDVALLKDTYADSATLNTAAAVTSSYDAAHDTAGERITVDEHRLSLLIAERDRFFLSSGVGVHGEATFNAAATSVLKVFGAIWHLEVVED